MPKISSSRAKTVAAPKKPAPKAKTKTEKKVAPKSTEWKAGGVKKNTVGGRGSDGPAKKVFVGGSGSDRSTRDQRELRERLNDVFAGGRGSSNRTVFSDYNAGGGRHS